MVYTVCMCGKWCIVCVVACGMCYMCMCGEWCMVCVVCAVNGVYL